MSSKANEFLGLVQDGKFKPDYPGDFKDHAFKLEGERVSVTMEKVDNSISSNQRRYFFGVFVKLLHKWFNEHGTECDKDDVLLYLKDKFLFREWYNPLSKSMTKAYISLSNNKDAMTKDEFTEKKESIQRWAAQSLELDLPDPAEGVEMYRQ